jgi:hypothetical protein
VLFTTCEEYPARSNGSGTWFRLVSPSVFR